MWHGLTSVIVVPLERPKGTQKASVFNLTKLWGLVICRYLGKVALWNREPTKQQDWDFPRELNESPYAS